MVPWPIRKTGMETNLQALEAIDHETTDTRRRTVSGRLFGKFYTAERTGGLIIRAIDPGTKQSAYADWDGEKVLSFGKYENERFVTELCDADRVFVIETIAGYGMAVGKDVFTTCWWAGRMHQAVNHFGRYCHRMERREVKVHLCGSARAKDKNIIVAVVDRLDPDREFGAYGKGTKKRPGPLYGIAADCWQALALAITWLDLEVR